MAQFLNKAGVAAVLGAGGFLNSIVVRAQTEKEEITTLEPWRVTDTAYSVTLADDRSNAQSHALQDQYYASLAPEQRFTGKHDRLHFRVAPRSETWAGLLVLDANDTPVLLSGGYHVDRTTPDDRSMPGAQWTQYDAKTLYSDASSIIAPCTRIAVSKNGRLVDESTIDFLRWDLPASTVQMQRPAQWADVRTRLCPRQQ